MKKWKIIIHLGFICWTGLEGNCGAGLLGAAGFTSGLGFSATDGGVTLLEGLDGGASAWLGTGIGAKPWKEYKFNAH